MGRQVRGQEGEKGQLDQRTKALKRARGSLQGSPYLFNFGLLHGVVQTKGNHRSRTCLYRDIEVAHLSA